MGKRSNYDVLVMLTNNTALVWKNVHGIMPEDVAQKMDVAMLDWQYELTKTLKIWIDKGMNMSTGELILARANLGAVVESWLRFFYCVYYLDYVKNPRTDKKGKILEPEKDLKLETLKEFSKGILWDNDQSKDYVWVDEVQHKRNAIHAFTYRDIGTPAEFLADIDRLYEFVEMIQSHLPPVEDWIGCYPAGYVQNVYFD